MNKIFNENGYHVSMVEIYNEVVVAVQLVH